MLSLDPHLPPPPRRRAPPPPRRWVLPPRRRLPLPRRRSPRWTRTERQWSFLASGLSSMRRPRQDPDGAPHATTSSTPARPWSLLDETNAGPPLASSASGLLDANPGSICIAARRPRLDLHHSTPAPARSAPQDISLAPDLHGDQLAGLDSHRRRRLAPLPAVVICTEDPIAFKISSQGLVCNKVGLVCSLNFC
jgi:hypothetical protein